MLPNFYYIQLTSLQPRKKSLLLLASCLPFHFPRIFPPSPIHHVPYSYYTLSLCLYTCTHTYYPYRLHPSLASNVLHQLVAHAQGKERFGLVM